MQKTRKKKICIIEDEDAIREIYETVLKKKGYRVTTAADGEEGLRVLKSDKPDAILLDLIIPRMDGLELLQKIRSDSELSGLPVIIMTNVDNMEIVKKVGKYDTSFYLIKSQFDPKKMAHMVEEVLHKKT